MPSTSHSTYLFRHIHDLVTCMEQKNLFLKIAGIHGVVWRANHSSLLDSLQPYPCAKHSGFLLRNDPNAVTAHTQTNIVFKTH